MDFQKDFAKYTDKLKNAKTVEVPFSVLGDLEETFIHGLLLKGLTYIDQHFLTGTVQMVVSEVIQNAEKSQLKRVFYEQNNVKPEGETSDQAKSFGKAFLEKLRALRSALKKTKRKSEFSITIADGNLIARVVNPGLPSPRESELMGRALELAAGSQAEALDLIDQAGDTGESRGLGLILAVMALKRAGLPPSCLQWTAEKNRTVFEIRIPGNHEPPDLDLINEYIQEIDQLPSMSETLRDIIAICNSEKSDARQVAREIEKDQVVASHVLKLANSGGFAGGNIADILEAVKIVGIGNIAGMLLNVGASAILEERYGISDDLKNHPVKVAFYCRLLARKNKLAAVADQAYVARLLHDLGNVVLVAGLKQRNREDLKKLMRRDNLRNQLNMEEIFCGVSHATLGALLGDKWNFPETLVTAIDLHHTPHLVEKPDRELVFLVYLANAIADYQDGKTSFFALEPDVMEFFNITTEQAFELIVASLDAEFQKAG